MARILLCAGEASSDLLGVELLRELETQVTGLEVRGLVGPHLRAAGVTQLACSEDATVIGWSAVPLALPRVMGISRLLKRTLRSWRPDLVITIDSPGLLLPIAREARRLGIPAIHWVSPQVWAWRPHRVHKIALSVDLLLTLLPFEAELYSGTGLRCVYTGHPIVERIQRLSPPDSTADRPRRVVIAPGSRASELKAHMPTVAAVVAHLRARFENIEVVIPVASTVDKSLFGSLNARLVDTVSESAVGADAALVASGTATMEFAALGVPMVVFYKTSALNWWLGKRLITGVQHLSLVNIIAGREIAKEHLQKLDAGQIANDIVALLEERDHQQRQDLEEVTSSLGNGGAARIAAREVMMMLPHQNKHITSKPG